MKKCKLVMLPTEKASVIGIGSTLMPTHNYNLAYAEKPFKVDSIKSQHLYITSNEEIKEGDWFIHNNKIYNASNFNTNSSSVWSNEFPKGIYSVIQEHCSKIIATTDSSLNLPLISNEFVKLFVDSYNNGNVINEVNVDIFMKNMLPETGINENIADITITPVKQSFTREEVFNMMWDLKSKSIGSATKEGFNKWFKSNY